MEERSKNRNKSQSSTETISIVLALKPLLDRLIYPIAKWLLHIDSLRCIQIRLRIHGTCYMFRPFVLSDLLVIFTNWEPYVKKVFRPTYGDVVFDVGAHIGHYTIMMARLVGEIGLVVSFEPDLDSFRILRQSIRMNGLRNVRLFNAAVGDKKGWVKFNADFEPLSSSLKAQNAKDVVVVKMLCLDDVVQQMNLSHIDWLKIDVEKTELQVLKGADCCLRNIVKKVIIETDSLETLSFLISKGFQMKKIYRLYYYGLHE